MAEKHKSKYKAPKDLEKSQKPKPRKDLKDYTEDDKQGALNPKSTGEKQTNVLRKTDKEMVDTGDMYVKYNADDRLYKDLEDGEYDPKHAAKVLKKRQDKDEKDNAKNIKDKIENLTREQKEYLVREYVRRKLNKILSEQTAPEPPAEEPAPEAAPEEVPTEPATDMGATDTGMDMAAPATPAPTAAPTTSTDAPTTDVTPDASTPTAPTPAEVETRAITAAANELSAEGNIGKLKMINKIFNLSLAETEPEDKSTFYKLLRSFAIKKLNSTK
jgi:hypothetical protein